MMTNSDKVIATAGQVKSDNNGPHSTKHQVKSVEDYKKDNLACPQKHLPEAHQILINISGESEGRDSSGPTTRQRKDEASHQNSQGSSAVQSYRVVETINTPQLL